MVKTSRFQHGRSAKISQLHLPSLPTRSKHLSMSVTRMNRDNAPRQVPASGRGGGTGRREAVTPSRDGPRKSVTSHQVKSNTVLTRQSGSNVRSGDFMTVSKVGSSFLYRVMIGRVSNPSFCHYLHVVCNTGQGDAVRSSTVHPVQTDNPASSQPSDLHPGQTLDPVKTCAATYSSPRRSVLLTF